MAPISIQIEGIYGLENHIIKLNNGETIVRNVKRTNLDFAGKNENDSGRLLAITDFKKPTENKIDLTVNRGETQSGEIDYRQDNTIKRAKITITSI
ncbi:MAG: hypothetical protein WCT51_01840 [Candidatus Shapirobacteria bacterium]